MQLKKNGVTVLVFAVRALYFKCFLTELRKKRSKLDQPTKATEYY